MFLVVSHTALMMCTSIFCLKHAIIPPSFNHLLLHSHSHIQNHHFCSRSPNDPLLFPQLPSSIYLHLILLESTFLLYYLTHAVIITLSAAGQLVSLILFVSTPHPSISTSFFWKPTSFSITFLLPLPQVSSSAELAHHFCIQMKRFFYFKHRLQHHDEGRGR